MFTKFYRAGIFVTALMLLNNLAYGAHALNISQWSTSHGARVYFVRTPEIPMVEINIAFAAGSSYDGDKPGLAQFTGNMLDEGTATLNADQVAQQFDDVGAQFNTAVNRDMAVVSFQSLTDAHYFQPALNVFTDVLTHSTFPNDAFLRTQKQTLIGIQQRLQDPDGVAAITFFRQTYGDHPYAHPVLGTQQSVTAITREDIANFYKKYYVAKNAVIAIVGDVTQEQAKTLAENITAGLPQGEAAPAIPPAKLAATKTDHINFPSEQTHIIVGQVGINYHNPNYFPLIVGNYILGGAPLTSLLFTNVREQRGLAYSINSAFVPLNAGGPFVLMLQTRNHQANEALKVAQQTFDQFITQGPTEIQLTAAKKKISNGFPLTLVGNDAISSQLLNIGFYHLPLDYLDTYRAKINALTLAQVKEALQQTLYPNKMVTVTVGNNN